VRGADAALLAKLRESAQGFPGTEVGTALSSDGAPPLRRQPIGIAPPGTCCATSSSRRSARTGLVR
jgi:hypothetical protein